MRGRTIVFVSLLGFVLLATGVIWRRSAGVLRAREVKQLETRRAELAAQRTKLDADIRSLISLEKLGRVVEERQHMQVPSDSLVITLTRASRVALR